MHQTAPNVRGSAEAMHRPGKSMIVNLRQGNVKTHSAYMAFLRFFNFIQVVNSSSMQKEFARMVMGCHIVAPGR